MSVAELRAQLRTLMGRIENRGERFIIERRGRPLAALVSMEDLKTVEGAQEGISSRPLGALALVGAWSEAEEKELDAVLEEVYAAR